MTRLNQIFMIISCVVALPFGVLLLAMITGLVKLYRVPTGGMSPTIASGEFILAPKWWGSPSDLRRDQAVVFSAERIPFDGMQLTGTYIQRIVALPGDTVSIESGAMYVNGQRVEKDGRTSQPPGPTRGGRKLSFPLIVPEGQIFLMGDNYSNSLDSRYFGPVEISRISHQPSHRVFPLGRMGKID